MPGRQERPMVTPDRLFTPVAEQPNGAKLFIKRGRARRRGQPIGAVNDREVAYIKQHLPEIAAKVWPAPKVAEPKPEPKTKRRFLTG